VVSRIDLITWLLVVAVVLWTAWVLIGKAFGV
jgi:hypothetical protein